MATLYLIPVPLGPTPAETQLLPEVIALARSVTHFAVEKAKTARAHLKDLGHPLPMRDISMVEIDGADSESNLGTALTWIRDGFDVGLMSEAGCPGVADPGAKLVALCHENGFEVRPLIGPSSILLAIMGSGLNGQRFSFNGYLPAKPDARDAEIRRLEKRSRDEGSLQLFIETPYRNAALFGALRSVCLTTTRLSIASDLGLPSQTVATARISEWRSRPEPELDRRPTVFSIQAS